MASKGLLALLNGLKALRLTSEASKEMAMPAFLGWVKKYVSSFLMGALKDYNLGGFLPVDQLVTAFVTNYVDKAAEFFPVSKKWEIIDKLEARIASMKDEDEEEVRQPDLPILPAKPTPPKAAPAKTVKMQALPSPPKEADPNGPI